MFLRPLDHLRRVDRFGAPAALDDADVPFGNEERPADATQVLDTVLDEPVERARSFGRLVDGEEEGQCIGAAARFRLGRTLQAQARSQNVEHGPEQARRHRACFRSISTLTEMDHDEPERKAALASQRRRIGRDVVGCLADLAVEHGVAGLDLERLDDLAEVGWLVSFGAPDQIARGVIKGNATRAWNEHLDELPIGSVARVLVPLIHGFLEGSGWLGHRGR